MCVSMCLFVLFVCVVYVCGVLVGLDCLLLRYVWSFPDVCLFFCLCEFFCGRGGLFVVCVFVWLCLFVLCVVVIVVWLLLFVLMLVCLS